MFIVLLRFSENKARAPEFMQAHNDWIKRGLADGVFLIVGSLQPRQGGAVLAHGVSLEEVQARVAEDPFVAENIVAAEILDIAPGQADPRLAFLLPQEA